MDVIKEKIKKQAGGASSDQNAADELGKNGEREIRIPYHRPRHFTFQEFMARKYINKPTDDDKGISSKQAMINAKLHPEAFAMKMKLREEEALEFFRSSSSESEEESDKPIMEEIRSTSEIEKTDSEIFVENNDLPLQEVIPVEEKMSAQDPEEINIEKPEIDQNIFAAEILDETPLDAIKKPLPEKKPQFSLKPGEVLSFDLETGNTEVRPAKLSASEMFKKNFLDLLAKRTETKTTDINSKIANSIILHRPGEAREILLKSIIEPVHQEKIAALKKKQWEKSNNAMVELEPEDKEDYGRSDYLKSDEVNDDDDEEDEECEEEEEPEENDVVITDKKSKTSEFMDDEVSSKG